ncbi:MULTISPECIES: hypothetical protein [Actinomadura]|uniref:Uncharacterized protein n=1 Tax=Actinomadura yumaensis TaxID=111807 RepID=A0ABW2CL61_9ACTN|nr:hypothetical protein [Actinomadura sp. J1-007]
MSANFEPRDAGTIDAAALSAVPSDAVTYQAGTCTRCTHGGYTILCSDYSTRA